MAKHGAVAVLNPESNLKIGSGIPPIPKLVAAGVPCALGTDGASTNDNLILQGEPEALVDHLRQGDGDDVEGHAAGHDGEERSIEVAQEVGEQKGKKHGVVTEA